MPTNSRLAASITCVNRSGQTGSCAVGSTLPPNSTGLFRSVIAFSCLVFRRAFLQFKRDGCKRLLEALEHAGHLNRIANTLAFFLAHVLFQRVDLLNDACPQLTQPRTSICVISHRHSFTYILALMMAELFSNHCKYIIAFTPIKSLSQTPDKETALCIILPVAPQIMKAVDLALASFALHVAIAEYSLLALANLPALSHP